MMENAPAAISHTADQDINTYNILDKLLKIPKGVTI
jgi:hypothetical protein